jgi:hypothetical protein
MREIRIFVASSTKGIPLAERLVESLNHPTKAAAPASEDGECPRSEEFLRIKAVHWTKGFRASQFTLENLIAEAKQCDFAAVILTKDDAAKKKRISGWLPRDNCIYEAGLFTGALGPSHQRCFLLSSVEPKDLPTDVQGLTYIPITPGQSKGARKSQQLAANEVRRCVLERGPFDRMLLGAHQLIERETRVSPNTLVYISSAEPLEREPSFANRVMKNMNRSVEYRYFFYDDPDIPQTIAGMIQTLAAVGVDKEPSLDAPLARRDRMDKKRDRVKLNLKLLQLGLAIHLQPKEPIYPCCIHNAGSDSPTCYLRFPCDGEPIFVAWKKGDAAKKVAAELRKSRPTQRPSVRHIFRLPQKKRSERIGAIADYLGAFFPPKLREAVYDACFDAKARASIKSKKTGSIRASSLLPPASKRRRRAAVARK